MDETNCRNNIERKIHELQTTKEAKDVLLRTLNVAKSENRMVKESVKSLFVICPSGAGVSDYAKLYEEILDKNGVYKMKGKVSYLELSFPKMSSDAEYDKFFQSPNIAAATLNSYIGVWLISFEQWKGFSELRRERAFLKLIRYIEENKKNTFFVFHVLPGFDRYDELRSVLNGHINLLSVVLENPNIETATEYVESSLSKVGITLENSAKETLGEIISARINLESEAFQGKKTLDRFTDNLIFEMTAETELVDELLVDDSMINRVSDKIDFNLDEDDKSRRIGFR